MIKKLKSRLIALAIFNSDGSIDYQSENFFTALMFPEDTMEIPSNLLTILSGLEMAELPKSIAAIQDCTISLSPTKSLILRNIGEAGYIGEILEDCHQDNESGTISLDSLTGIPTRGSMAVAFAEVLSSIDIEKQELVLMALDLDYFKKVNDTFGHAAGDELLKKVVQRIKNVIRETDMLIRMGGDEFALVHAQAKDKLDSQGLASRIIERISRPFLINGNQINIGVSIGMVAGNISETDPTDLHKKADIALYQSKAGGKGRFTWYERKMAEEIELRHKLEVELRRALVMGQLKLKYEPQIYQMSGEVHTLQTRLIWSHPEHGEMEEARFIGLADDIGLIPEISRWQFDSCFKEAATLKGKSEISIDVHSRFFAEEGLVEFISALSKKHKVNLDRVCLEFTESTLLENEKIAGELMLRLSQLGIRLSLGDFGSGLVALSYLRVLPFSEIKIDFSSVMDASDDNEKSSVASRIAELGRSLGIRVLASVDDSKVIHKVLSEGQFSHIEKLKVAAPIDVEKINDFLEHIETRRGESLR